MGSAMWRWCLSLVCLIGCGSFSMSEEVRKNLAVPATSDEAEPSGLSDGDPSNPDDAWRASWKPPDYEGVVDDGLGWQRANLTTYTSYPAEGSEECIKYNGCYWRGRFTAFGDHVKKSPAWVAEHNIAAVRFDHFNERAFRTLRLRSGRHSIDVVVYDSCADTDCDGCCTRNSSETGFLIDLEVHTAARFGVYDGTVEWACIDCERDASLFPKPGKTHSDAERPRGAARQGGPKRRAPRRP
jgi:hypothetical protein